MKIALIVVVVLLIIAALLLDKIKEYRAASILAFGAGFVFAISLLM